jgi:hypothetical protein
MMDALAGIDRVIAISEISELKARRDHALDLKDWETYLSLHAPDHVSSHSVQDGGEVRSAQDLVRQLAITMDGVISAHHSHTPVITFETPHRAKCIWSMEDNLYWKQGDEDHWLHGYGFYHETCEKRDGTWLFTSRSLKRTHVMISPGGKKSAERAAESRSQR